MLLPYMIVSCLFLGSSARYEEEEVCYGRSLKLPFRYTPPYFQGPLYLTPSSGGQMRLVMDNGKAKDPKFFVSFGSVEFKDLRESDAGVLSVSYDGKLLHDAIKLKIKDCATVVTKYYGQSYVFDVPRDTAYIEFSPLRSEDQLKVLWNRTDPQISEGGRGKMKSGGWEIISITKEDNGYYNFRTKYNTLRSRIMLSVQVKRSHYDLHENDRLHIPNPFGIARWTVSFSSEVGYDPQLIIKEGNLHSFVNYVPFHHRIQLLDDGIEIDPVKMMDSGSFEFKDLQGNVAQVVTLQVQPEVTPTYIYVAFIGGIVLAVIFCCCSVRKCCCKKSSSKRSNSAPAAVHQNDQNQPAGPSYSAAPPNYSHRQVNLPARRQPAATSTGPPVHKPVNKYETPCQPEAAAPRGQGEAPAPSLGSDSLSSDADPKFEIKGRFFSAPPLHSNSTFSDVYTSDKLNFL